MSTAETKKSAKSSKKEAVAPAAAPAPAVAAPVKEKAPKKEKSAVAAKTEVTVPVVVAAPATDAAPASGAAPTLLEVVENIRQIRARVSADLKQAIADALNAAKTAARDIKDARRKRRVKKDVADMTPEERKNPAIINGTRRARLAKGSGTNIEAVNKLMKQFEETRLYRNI